jgi:hypothetical protein
MMPCTKDTMLNNSGVISFRVDGYLVSQARPAKHFMPRLQPYFSL